MFQYLLYYQTTLQKKRGLLNPFQSNAGNQIQVKNLMLPYLYELAFVLAQKQKDYKE